MCWKDLERLTEGNRVDILIKIAWTVRLARTQQCRLDSETDEFTFRAD
jgi:hypothetical protein